MLTLIKNIIISTVISLTLFIGLEYLRDQALQIPINKADVSELFLIFIAVLISTCFVSATTNSYSEEYDPRETGSVKWFNVKKGYGFITRDQGDDIFVHYRNIEGAGRRSINDGERVSFIVIDGDKGLQADEVMTI
ncbi:MAG: cold shock domain-containing protein [Gammaproteobacteria bacterium TMED1]|nr:MAG: cold shock domain-containing protein [Gammaproteobacteria bacterium TMED1]